MSARLQHRARRRAEKETRSPASGGRVPRLLGHKPSAENQLWAQHPTGARPGEKHEALAVTVEEQQK